MPTTTITSGVSVVPPGWAALVAVSLTLAACLVVLCAARRAIAETTLVAAWWWTISALTSWSLVEIEAAFASPVASKPWLEPLRLAAMALTFCPVVALIGAKRPQHLAWNFVVLALWGIVALPAAEAFFLRRGQRIDMGDARGWFLWLLILLTPINYVPTRFWPAALVVAAGQALALAPHLPLLRRLIVTEWIALALCGCGILLAGVLCLRRRSAANAYDQLWLDFRDAFGLFWSLRVQDRVNAAARQFNWDFELTWFGFRRPGERGPLAMTESSSSSALRTTLKGLLRRFVSNRWIAERQSQMNSRGRESIAVDLNHDG